MIKGGSIVKHTGQASRPLYISIPSRTRGRTARSAALGLLVVAVLSCGGEDTTAPPPTRPTQPTALQPARVTLEPETVAVVAGDTIRVTARVYNDRARVISDAMVTWTSSDPTVATVDATGLVTGLKEGNASLTATSGPATASAPMAVRSQDRATLMDLYQGAGGGSWTNNENWESDAPMGSWYGVEANAEGRVTALRLSENGLRGQLPENLGDLALLIELLVDGNALSGPIPVSLSNLPIQQFLYGGTMLCTVRDEGFQAWLNGIPTREGEFSACNEDRSDLIKLYEAMGGPSWTNSRDWLTDAPLDDWHGIAVDRATGRVAGMNLSRNNLSGEIPPEIRFLSQLEFLRLDYNRLRGEIPPEIGELTELVRLDLDGNLFRGRIPAEIGNLKNLRTLWLGGNQMTGPLPPEMGNLASLQDLYLYEARFEGSIPEEFAGLTELLELHIWDTRIEGPLPESLGALRKLETMAITGTSLSGPLPAALGQMDNLRVLALPNNEIDGPLPGELGQADKLRMIRLENNRLSGPLPAGLGDAGALFRLWLQNNPDLSGPLPESMTALGKLEELIANGTGLCLPQTPAFRTWLASAVLRYRIKPCGAEGEAEAYLTQAAQSREYPVPLVGGESALLRVFVMSEQETGAMIPPVRTTFFVDGAEVHAVDIPAGSSAIPTEVQEGEFDLSANVEIPAEVIQPGLEMVVEVDPDGTVDPNLGVSKRIPETGRAAVDVRAVPPMYLTLVPFVWTGDNDREAATFVSTADPADDIFWETNNLLPVGTLEIRRHEAVTVDSNDIEDLLEWVGRIRLMEEGVGHWMGLSPDPAGASGIAYLGTHRNPNLGKTSVARLSESTIAHELGHNLNLLHADCGDPSRVDLTFPYDNARTGVWGYDPRDGGSLVPPDRADIMSYCDPAWISDYHFTHALRFRFQDTHEVWEAPVAATKTLLVSGGVTSDGEPRLDPAFVVDTRPVWPDSAGPWQLTGRRADGGELFSLSFTMAETWDGDGRSGFAFALPVQAEWETELTSLSLSGPGGSVEMAEGSEPPLAILRDPVTGEVRAIFTDLPAGPLARSTADALAPEPGLEVLVSSGLPDASAWRR